LNNTVLKLGELSSTDLRHAVSSLKAKENSNTFIIAGVQFLQGADVVFWP